MYKSHIGKCIRQSNLINTQINTSPKKLKKLQFDKKYVKINPALDLNLKNAHVLKLLLKQTTNSHLIKYNYPKININTINVRFKAVVNYS
jgi:hypothetical protein